jgi:tRNA (guanine6-N2)-methyltransferase
LLAGVQPGARLVDPFCGAGTIPIEAALACRQLHAVGFDLDDRAIAAALANASAAGVEVSIARADAAALPLADESVDRIVTNPPWGSAVRAGGQAGADPASFAREALRVLAPHGRVALVTPPSTPFDRAVRRALEVLAEEWVRIAGIQASLLLLARSR